MIRPLLLALLAALALAAPAAANVGGFEGADGNQECTLGLDWQCLPTGWELKSADEASNGGDDVFAGGKEEEPAGWSFDVNGTATSSKTDITNLWSTAIYDETAKAPYLFLAFHRVDGGTSNAFFTFELNQDTSTWTNTHGADVPCRTDGDVQIAYELPGTITLYQWVGSGGPTECPDGATGTWTGPVNPAADREAGLNGSTTPIASYFADGPATMARNTFGEAALNLSEVVREVGLAKCTYFKGVQAHSRTSSSDSSTMSDYVADTGIDVVACPAPPTGSPQADPATVDAPAGCAVAGELTLTGTAAPGTQVEIIEGSTSRGLAPVTASDGTWSATIATTTGNHTYTAVVHETGKTDSAGTDRTVVVDATRPAAPVITSPVDGSTLTSGTVTVSGTAEPGSDIEIREGSTVVGQATADNAGAWSTTVTVSTGAHSFSVTAADCAPGAASTVAFTTKAGDGGGNGGGDTGGNGGGPSGPSTPQQEVKGDTDTGTCDTKVFTVSIPAKGVKRVVFRIDGVKYKTVSKKTKKRFVLKLDPKTFAAGKHKISAQLVMRNGSKRTVPMRSFTRCKLGKCVSRRSFHIRVKKIAGEKVVSATVRVNGKKVKVVRGKRLTAPVVLNGLPKGKVIVKIVSRTASGRKVTDTRRYKTCVPGKKKS
jgi:Big-like domain-containing protein